MAGNRRKVSSEDLKSEVLAKIKQYQNNGFSEAGKIHQIIMEANPNLHPRLWYGMPGYAKTKDSAVLCFFRKDTLVSFGLTESARLDDSEVITASSWYIRELTNQVEQKISQVVQQATN